MIQRPFNEPAGLGNVSGAVVSAAIGVVAGIGGYTFVYAQGASYLTNNPAACANCHIMQQHFDAWTKSSHRAVAVCNDCHTPPGVLRKYAVKASNGFWHSVAFTTGEFPEPLRIKPRNLRVTEDACRICHDDIVQTIDTAHRDGRQLSCVRCHWTVGHL